MTKRPFRPIWGGCSPNIDIFRCDFPTYIFIGDTPLSWYTSILILFSVLKFLSISFFDLPFFLSRTEKGKQSKKSKTVRCASTLSSPPLCRAFFVSLPKATSTRAGRSREKNSCRHSTRRWITLRRSSVELFSAKTTKSMIFSTAWITRVAMRWVDFFFFQSLGLQAGRVLSPGLLWLGYSRYAWKNHV